MGGVKTDMHFIISSFFPQGKTFAVFTSTEKEGLYGRKLCFVTEASLKHFFLFYDGHFEKQTQSWMYFPEKAWILLSCKSVHIFCLFSEKTSFKKRVDTRWTLLWQHFLPPSKMVMEKQFKIESHWTWTKVLCKTLVTSKRNEKDFARIDKWNNRAGRIK